MGINEFIDRGLKRIQKDLEKKEVKKEVKVSVEEKVSVEVNFDEIFNSNFMKKYTYFSSFDELLKSGNFFVNSQEDFENIPDDIFDKHIQAVTHFGSWQEMLNEAANQYTQNIFNQS
ncbi:hypothetical protein Ami103574_04275 [Aminipila butyrica]|uniref:Uncharacterized protein n=1 Tax=Aminipila butyrica TaxID=433296 RepID=A0A858BUX9_9FIRM|nr:hypothetical protein [Aminipila butyrica]QIB68584.1 hypothetical protein Ami103574_04275 [Aminipila butyrica]